MSRGGARPGAGRKKTGNHTLVFWVSDAEELELRKKLEELRTKKAETASTSLEATLEAKGQMKLFTETISKPKPKGTSKEKSKKEPKRLVNEALVNWKVNLRSEILKLKKLSKRKAADYLAEQLCKSINELTDDTDDTADQKIDYASEYIKDVVDARVRTDDWSNLITGFMTHYGYKLIRDDSFVKRWHKIP